MIWAASATSSLQCTPLASPTMWTLPPSASLRSTEALLHRSSMGRKSPLTMYRSRRSLQLLPMVSLRRTQCLKLLHQPNLQQSLSLNQRRRPLLQQWTTEPHQHRKLPSPKPKKLRMRQLTTEARRGAELASARATQIAGHINGRLL